MVGSWEDLDARAAGAARDVFPIGRHSSTLAGTVVAAGGLWQASLELGLRMEVDGVVEADLEVWLLPQTGAFRKDRIGRLTITSAFVANTWVLPLKPDQELVVTASANLSNGGRLVLVDDSGACGDYASPALSVSDAVFDYRTSDQLRFKVSATKVGKYRACFCAVVPIANFSALGCQLGAPRACAQDRDALVDIGFVEVSQVQCVASADTRHRPHPYALECGQQADALACPPRQSALVSPERQEASVNVSNASNATKAPTPAPTPTLVDWAGPDWSATAVQLLPHDRTRRSFVSTMVEFNASNQLDAMEMLVCEAKDQLEDRHPPCNETLIPELCTGLCQPVWARSDSVFPALVDKSFAPFIWWIDG